MTLGRTSSGAIKIKTDEAGGGLRAVECGCCVEECSIKIPPIGGTQPEADLDDPSTWVDCDHPLCGFLKMRVFLTGTDPSSGYIFEGCNNGRYFCFDGGSSGDCGGGECFFGWGLERVGSIWFYKDCDQYQDYNSVMFAIEGIPAVYLDGISTPYGDYENGWTIAPYDS